MEPSAFLREVQMIEFTNRWLWRFIRPFVKRQLVRRCANCVIPESYTPLGEDELCADCRELTPEPRQSSPPYQSSSGDVENILRHYAERTTGTHDALVLISGGKDSSLLLHHLHSAYPGLRMMTLLVDNGLMSPIALENAAGVRSKFDIDHLTLQLDLAFVNKGFRFTLTHLDRQERYSIVDLLDGTFTFNAARNMATHLKIPLIVCGLSKIQAKTVFGNDHYELPPGRELSAFEELANTPLDEIFDEDDLERFWDESKNQDREPPRFVMPFVSWDPTEDFILAEVERLGLLRKDRTRPLLTNNALIPIITIAEINHFGYSSFEVEFSKMIRGGKSDPAYWRNLFEMAEYSAKTGRFLSESTVETLKTLGLSKKDIGFTS